MKYNWTLIKLVDAEFPELYTLITQNRDSIKIFANSFKRRVKIQVQKTDGSKIESVISNGTIIRERDLITNSGRDLEEEFHAYHIDISSLPNSKVLEIIGGNYGVLTEFFGEIKSPKKSRDVNYLKERFKKIFKFPLQLWDAIYSTFSRMWQLPSWWDIFDFTVIASISYFFYNLNYDFQLTGLILAIGGLTSGFLDLLRTSPPYVAKVLLSVIPGYFAFYLGYIYQ